MPYRHTICYTDLHCCRRRMCGWQASLEVHSVTFCPRERGNQRSQHCRSKRAPNQYVDGPCDPRLRQTTTPPKGSSPFLADAKRL